MKNLTTTILAVAVAVSAAAIAPADTLYREKYRPQYHFTPAHRWIGDPCGNHRFGGRYMAYSWGAATSPDLVHWHEINKLAIDSLPQTIAPFTGGVVIDRTGSAGFGTDAAVAVFTAFDKDTKSQAQAIAPSYDGGHTFRYLPCNPVLDIGSTEFRDPTVVRDDANDRWIMLVAKALEKKVAFYQSKDLKKWEWMSDFGPMGDNERSWECPDMFRVPVDGDPTRMKWVLLVSVNWAREQYFTGEFTGNTFVPDAPYAEPLYVDEGLDYYASRVFQDYDNPANPEVYTLGWVNTWDYAQQAPTTYGKGIWSLPRLYGLTTTPEGLRLTQTPAPALAQLRGKATKTSLKLSPGVTALPQIAPLGNVYELEAVFSDMGADAVGLYLLEGDGRRMVLSYDPSTRWLTLDRTNTTDADIPKFERASRCKIPGDSSELRLHVFVDKSLVEIFVDDGRTVLTALTYPASDQTAVSAFALSPATLTLTVHPLRAIW